MSDNNKKLYIGAVLDKPVELTHNIYDTGHYQHSITVNGEEGLAVDYNEIARNGSFCAVTNYYSDYFPEVFMVTDFTSIAKRCTLQTGSSIKKTTNII